MSRNHGVDAAVLGGAATVPAHPATPQRAPPRGRWAGANPDPHPGRTRPPPPIHPLLGRR
jgi:hypothetical protein